MNKGKHLLVFTWYWLIVFILYLPAAEAGRVGDFPGWVDFLNSVNFWDYINRKGSGIPSMYQFTQVISYLFYQVFKGHAWPWHLLYVTLQALNALLVFTFFRTLLLSSAVRNAVLLAFSGATLFCVCPHISEVVVWEPAFHYLLALLLMLVVMICAQQYLHTQNSRYAWWGGIVFFLSTYSLEIFYLTPVFVLTLAVYKYSLLQCNKQTFRKTLLYFLAPEAVFFIVNQVLVHAIYHQGVAHIGFVSLLLSTENFSKLIKYIFHIVFFGRYFPQEIRNNVYHICESARVLIIFYAAMAASLLYTGVRYSKMKNEGKTVALLYIWVLCSFGLILPLSFPRTGLSILDRYTYQVDALIFMLIALIINMFTGNRYLLAAIMFGYALVNIRFTHRVNAYWSKSARIVNNLVYTFPNDPSKKVLLLDLPECFDGVQMVGSRDDGEFRMMYNAIMPGKLSNPVYDVEAFYVTTPLDGAHVKVMDDSTIGITLNQWGSYWLFYGFGAVNYENSDYRVNMKDAGHYYEVILKHPASEYLLLYQVAGEWKKVDWDKKNIDQY